MWRTSIWAMVWMAAMAGQPAAAWLLYPDREHPARTIVEIEEAHGDFVPFAALPAPFNTAVQIAQGPETLSYRWRYEDEADGLAFLRVDEDGRGIFNFEFQARELIEGRRLGAAAVLVAADGSPLHTFYARTETGSFATGRTHRVVLEAERPPDWWRRIAGIGFFYMTYHPIQNLDDADIQSAMRRAVRRFNRGQGTEQWG